MRLLYFASSSHGGLADYAREQVSAIARHGVEVDLLCAPAFPAVEGSRITRIEALRNTPIRDPGTGRLVRAIGFAHHEITNHHRLRSCAVKNGHDHVLFASYGEYFAPIWSRWMRRLQRRGVRFGSVVHDPIRDAALGPAAWHRRSVADAYSFLSHAFVHEIIELDTMRPMPDLKTTVVPHGPYQLKTKQPSKAEAREKLDLPPNDPVLLAFGHVRDNKNLNLTIEALSNIPKIHLVVAGSALSSGEKPITYYQQLAAEKGLAARCTWVPRHIEESEVGTFFSAADFVSLTYSAGFRSASGVLNVASQFRKPCIASSGPGPLERLVRQYELGIWIAPDSVETLRDGLKELISISTEPRWDDYGRDNSWGEHARIVVENMFGPSPQ